MEAPSGKTGIPNADTVIDVGKQMKRRCEIADFDDGTGKQKEGLKHG